MTARSGIVGDEIRKARQVRGWTPGDLVAAMGVEYQTGHVHRWEGGRGVGIGALLDIVGAMPEIGDVIIAMVREAQHRHGI